MKDKKDLKADSPEEQASQAKMDKLKASGSKYSQQVGDMAARKLKAQRHLSKTLWSGLGMMGLIGWSVAIPTVLGAVFGLWLDEQYPGGRSWTLALLVVGLCLGCFNAWHWVAKEDKDIHQHEDDDDVD